MMFQHMNHITPVEFIPGKIQSGFGYCSTPHSGALVVSDQIVGGRCLVCMGCIITNCFTINELLLKIINMGFASISSEVLD